MNHSEFEEAAACIPYQYSHPKMLYSLIKWTTPSVCVEVGTHIGMSAVWMARALQENGTGHLYCIDPFCWINETQEEQWYTHIEMCDVKEWVTLIKGRSQEVEWPQLIDFAFIDGNHTYGACKHDGEKAKSLGAKIICFHDSVSWEGSRKFCEEIRETWQGWDFLEENRDDGLLIAKIREFKVPSWGEDIGEKWDKPTK